MKIDPVEWRSDPNLRCCSLTARGLWIEIMCVMHEADPYGHLLVDGRPMTPVELAVPGGVPIGQISHLLGELGSAKVFSRTAEGMIYSPRMVRDERRRQVARRNGRACGNPKLGKTGEKSSPDNRAAATPKGSGQGPGQW